MAFTLTESVLSHIPREFQLDRSGALANQLISIQVMVV